MLSYNTKASELGNIEKSHLLLQVVSLTWEQLFPLWAKTAATHAGIISQNVYQKQITDSILCVLIFNNAWSHLQHTPFILFTMNRIKCPMWSSSSRWRKCLFWEPKPDYMQCSSPLNSTPTSTKNTSDNFWHVVKDSIKLTDIVGFHDVLLFIICKLTILTYFYYFL